VALCEGLRHEHRASRQQARPLASRLRRDQAHLAHDAVSAPVDAEDRHDLPPAAGENRGSVTAGAKEPIRQRNARSASSATGTPETPVTTKSLFPEKAEADSRKDSVTLRLA
jgi:hypothetical protein